jgi:hypothetical protein
MLPVGFEPTISADERTQTYALDSAATGTGFLKMYIRKKNMDKKRVLLLVHYFSFLAYVISRNVPEMCSHARADLRIINEVMKFVRSN